MYALGLVQLELHTGTTGGSVRTLSASTGVGGRSRRRGRA